MVPLGDVICNQNVATKIIAPIMLEYWYKEKRTLVDFRRGPLGPHFDPFAAHLKAEGYSRAGGSDILGKCCQFNAFLIERGITNCKQVTEGLIEPFLKDYLANTRTTAISYSPRNLTLGCLKRLFRYLVDVGAVKPPKPVRVRKVYDWLLLPYLQHLRTEYEFCEVTHARIRVQVGAFLDALGQKATRHRFKTLSPAAVESFLGRHLKDTPENLSRLGSSLRRFFQYCFVRRYTSMDYSGLIPPVRRYRHAALPKGMEDSALQRMLAAIDRTTPNGARDYAIMILMMGYGLRGVSVAELLLDDLDWQHSRIRIRAQKGGKEVVVPLLESVGDALIGYLRHRQSDTPFREVFLGIKAPHRPLYGLMISQLVRKYMRKAGIVMAGGGVRTLRHSWAIRALANDTPIKAIADVLGHRNIDTTFIYAKADLKSLREVTMPWPEKG